MGAREEVACRRQAGFTLLEMLVTLVVIAIVLGVVTPTVGRSVETLRQRAELAGFAAVLRHARERAVTTRIPHVVVVDETARKIVVRSGGPDGEVRETRSLPERLRLVSAPSTIGFDPIGSSTGGECRLVGSDGTWLVTVDPVTGRVKIARQ